jgi:hypothetical protein
MSTRQTPVGALNTIRLSVIETLAREQLTRYDLAKRLKGTLSQRSVYDFFDLKVTNVRFVTVIAILAVCEMYVEQKYWYQWYDKDLKIKWSKHANEQQISDDQHLLKLNIVPPPVAANPASAAWLNRHKCGDVVDK